MKSADFAAASRQLRRVQSCAELVLAIAIAVVIWYPVAKGLLDGRWQWDFKVYYAAGRAWVHGKDPYSHKDIVAELGEDCYHFVYSPLVLPGFALVANLPLASALAWWAIIKLGCLSLLLVIWFRYFIQPGWRFWFTLMCGVGYAETITQDLITGNVSLIEQCLLWTAFAFFGRGRYVAFAVFTIAASVFKLTLAAFLMLLVCPVVWEGCRRVRLFVISGAFWGAIVGAGYTMAPERWRAFSRAAAEFAPGGAHFEFGASCPSTGAAIWELLRPLHSCLPCGLVPAFWVSYALVAATILIVTRWFIGHRQRAVFRGDERLWAIGVACLLFAVLSPRFKDYSYILLLVPTCRVLMHHSRDALPPVLLIGAMLMPPSSPRNAELHGVFAALSAYYPLVVAFAAWVIAVCGPRRIGHARPRFALSRRS